MSRYTVVESKRSKKNTGKKGKKDSDSDEYEEALKVIDNEDMKTFIRIKSQLASQRWSRRRIVVDSRVSR